MIIENIPDKIYLQFGDDIESSCMEKVIDFHKDLDEITWCVDNIFKTDLTYYSEEFMFEFTKWCAKNYTRGSKSWFKDLEDTKFYTTKELLEQFKKLKEENVQE